MGVEIPAQAIRDAQAADGELWPVLLALAGPESSWNPRAVGDGGCSLGYLQMNTCGGLGTGHAPEVLFDGVTNFRLGAQHIRAEMARGRSLYEALWPWTVRDTAWALYARIQREGISPTGDLPVAPAPSGTRPEPSPERGSALALVALALLVLVAAA